MKIISSKYRFGEILKKYITFTGSNILYKFVSDDYENNESYKIFIILMNKKVIYKFFNNNDYLVIITNNKSQFIFTFQKL